MFSAFNCKNGNGIPNNDQYSPWPRNRLNPINFWKHRIFKRICLKSIDKLINKTFVVNSEFWRANFSKSLKYTILETTFMEFSERLETVK